MSGNKRKISSGSEISFSELKPLAEDGDAIADSAKKAANEIKVETYQIKRMKVKARGNNALGNKVVNDIVLFFDKDIKHCDQSANDIAHGLVK